MRVGRWWARQVRAHVGGAGRGTRGERGNAIVEFCYLGILFLVPLVYIMLAVFDVQRAMYGVSAATRDAGRAYVLSANVGQAEARAREAARIAMADQGLGQGYTFQSACQGGCLQSGSSVEITVRYVVRFPFIPDAIGGPLVSFPVTSVHRTPYGDYRQSR
ncbi:hypothetical protein ABN034_25280 [Actinopolymorpha sp. B11F2]|uniref:hypothetical protein n=1 Tax=Actinopolymorpha sp. B11F2 TaxID=3160862 RepID=UPI0032E50FF9